MPFRGNSVIVNPPWLFASRACRADLSRQSRFGDGGSRPGEGGSRSVKVNQTDMLVKLATQISRKHLNMNNLQNKQPCSGQTRLNLVNIGMILPDVPNAAGQI